MALVSVIPLASKSCLRRSFISSTQELKPLFRTIPTLGMWRRGKYFTPSINMCLRTTISDDDSVQRRVADYHSNLWDDDFIQSLSTPYEASSYRERADIIVGEVKEIFASISIEDGETISLLQRLWMVNNVERLGISRHFETEIKVAIEYVYRSIYLGPLSSLGEKVVEEVEIFATTFLKGALQNMQVSDLFREIEYVLEYGWLTNFPRLEAMNYIDVFGEDMNPCLKWWKDSGFSQLTFTRHRRVEFYTLASCIATEPKHSAFRVGFAKLCYLVIVLDDIYDTFGRMNELELFTAAIKRWDLSATKCLPEYMKGVYMVFYDCVNEMVGQAEKTQGRDTLNYARKVWEALFDAFLEEAKWISSGYLPTFEEYLENGKVSFGYRATTLQPILTLDIPLLLHILQEIDFP